jgi:hypothetical protein
MYPFGKTCRVERIHIHPNWNADMKSYDVALVKLDCVVETTEKIKPVKLAKFNDAFLRTRADEPVVVTGYGKQSSRTSVVVYF